MPDPGSTSWCGTTFADVRAFLVGGSPLAGVEIVSLQKLGRSSFYDRQKRRWDFVHGEVEYFFAYDRASCRAASAAAPDRGVYINYSPYGPWNVTFDAVPDGVESIRLEFLLETYAMGGAVFVGEQPCDCGRPAEDSAQCASRRCGANPTAPSPLLPPPSPAQPPPPAGADGPCTTYPQFTGYTLSVDAACCGPTGAGCPADGIPLHCDESCARVLLPLRRDCAAFLANIGMYAAVESAVMACPPPPPPTPCTTYPEFTPFADAATAACCVGAEAPCVAGLPTVCTTGCADALLPMRTQCAGILAAIGMKDSVDAVAAGCTGGAGGGH
jgi:hypothetical protein